MKLVASGVCHTDASAVMGAIPNPLPAVMGHEGVGIVDEVGTGVTSVLVGDHVVLNYALSCGICFQCQRGSVQLCDEHSPHILEGVSADGTTRLRQGSESLYHFHRLSTFAEYAVVPEGCAIPVRREAPLEQLAPLGCGAITGWGAVVRRGRVEPGDSVLVYGVGGVGLASLMAARVAGCRPIIAVDRSAEALALATELGASHAVLVAPESDVVAEILRIAPRGTDHAFDTVGAPGTMERALAATRNGGQVVSVGTTDLADTISVPVMSLIFERRITGTAGGSIMPRIDIPLVVELFMAGSFPLDRLVTRSYELSEIDRALADLEHGAAGRGVIHL